MDRIARVTEINRNINNQSNVKSILFTAVNETGRHWKVSRCISVLCTPGKAPSMAVEYCATGSPPTAAATLIKLVALIQPLLVAYGPVTVGDNDAAPAMAPLKQLAASMGISAMLTVP